MKININGYIIPNEYKRVYDWFGMDSCCPNDIKAARLKSVNEPLEITIGTCYGGSIFAGSEIGSEIASHTPGSTGQIMGLAASAASVLAMYIKHLSMAPTAMMMVHNVSSYADGDYHVMDKEKTILINCNKAMAAAYTLKSGITEDETLKMMDKETWLTAQQAKERGLVNEILFENLDPTQMVAAVGPGMIPKAVIEKTLAMLDEKKDPVKSIKDTKKFDLAKAKLNLIEKTMF
mgnify:CR=1 FL=1